MVRLIATMIILYCSQEKTKLAVTMGYACYSFNIRLYGSLYPWFSRVVSSFRTCSKVFTCTPEPSEEEEVEEEEIIEDEEEEEEEDEGSSPTIEVPPGPGDGLSTGRNEKPGESRLEQDSGVPVELIVGCRLDIATSNLDAAEVNRPEVRFVGGCN